MIEIIREEDASGTIEKRGLPKDIKQIGKPDIGDRIYVENRVYQFLHPYSSLDEKKAYVLLGRFENYAGKQCVFVEAAIPLLDMAFDGEMPMWNDHTWAYIYKQLKHEYDSMVIVGWAMDIKGQLPNMTGRLEALHQNNFGGAHQVLFLMDSLEREETFYGSRNGHLYRREGFYIYYEKNAAEQRNAKLRAAEITQEENGSENITADEEESRGNDQREDFFQELEAEWRIGEAAPGEVEEAKEAFEGSRAFADTEEKEIFGGGRAYSRTETPDHGFLERGMAHRGRYRKQVEEQGERQLVPSYASTVLLIAVVCALGVTAYLNNEKMAAMEATLAQMNQPQTAVMGQSTEAESETGAPEVKVESVAGNIPKQEEAAIEASAEEAAQQQTDQGTGIADADASASDVTAAGTDAASDAEGAGTDAASDMEGTDNTSNAQEEGTDTKNVTSGTKGESTDAKNTGLTDKTSGTTTASGLAETAQQPDGTASQSSDVDKVDSAATATDAQTYLNQGYYVVQKGDSLVGICKKIYQTTAMLDKLCEVNGIEDEDSIYAGQYLTLPN